MKQAISGVMPPELAEVTIMTVWPTSGSTAFGRTLGQLYAVKAGIGKFFTLGKLFALALIPVALGLFFFLLLPGVGRRYRLTNRRLIVEGAITGKPERWVSLDDFDTIDIEVLPGQEWYSAGEMIFRKGTMETFRLHGVSRPQAFRATCLKAHLAHSQVERDRRLASR